MSAAIALIFCGFCHSPPPFTLLQRDRVGDRWGNLLTTALHPPFPPVTVDHQAADYTE